MTAEVEFLGKFTRKSIMKTPDEQAYDKAQKIIHGEDYEEVTTKSYSYEPHVIDLLNVVDFMRLDDRHTQVLMRYMNYYILKIPYEEFKLIKQHLTGSMIRSADKFPTREVGEVDYPS